MIATRLDPVVRLRERDEDEKGRELAACVEGSVRAAERVADIERRLRRDGRARASAADFELQERERERLEALLDQARNELRRCRDDEHAARESLRDAHRRAEVVRRAAETRRTDVRRARDRWEQKQMDEVASRRR